MTIVQALYHIYSYCNDGGSGQQQQVAACTGQHVVLLFCVAGKTRNKPRKTIILLPTGKTFQQGNNVEEGTGRASFSGGRVAREVTQHRQGIGGARTALYIQNVLRQMHHSGNICVGLEGKRQHNLADLTSSLEHANTIVAGFEHSMSCAGAAAP